MKHLSVEQLHAARAQLAILDVRSDEEHAIAALPGTLNICLQELPQRFGELDPRQPLAVLCHHGVRSQMAAQFLQRQGFTDVANIDGGIDAWALRIDPSVARY